MTNETASKMKQVLILSALTAFFSTIGCMKVNVTKAETLTRERRAVSPFDEILVASGSFDVYLTQGDVESVEVETDDNLQQYVEVRNEMGRLVLDIKDDANFEKTTKNNVYITLRNITTLGVMGAGRIETLNPLNCGHLSLNVSGVVHGELEVYCDKLNVNNSGAADVKLSGAAAKLYINNSGVGTLNTRKLKAAMASVANSGVGDVNVYATEELWMTNSGMGFIAYSGGAEIRANKTSGFGRITKAE